MALLRHRRLHATRRCYVLAYTDRITFGLESIAKLHSESLWRVNRWILSLSTDSQNVESQSLRFTTSVRLWNRRTMPFNVYDDWRRFHNGIHFCTDASDLHNWSVAHRCAIVSFADGNRLLMCAPSGYVERIFSCRNLFSLHSLESSSRLLRKTISKEIFSKKFSQSILAWRKNEKLLMWISRSASLATFGSLDWSFITHSEQATFGLSLRL